MPTKEFGNLQKKVSIRDLIFFTNFGFKLRTMETLRIEIVNPKAKRLLQDLADLNLISISKSLDSKTDFRKLLSKLRSDSDTAPSLDEINMEVENARALRYASKSK